MAIGGNRRLFVDREPESADHISLRLTPGAQLDVVKNGGRAMPFRLDAEVAAVFAAAAEAGGALPVTPRGDAIALRAVFNMGMQLADAAEPDSPSVRTVDHSVPVRGGEIRVRWYTKEGSAPGSAVVYYHGGGMVCGSVDLYDRLVSKYVQATGVPFLSVDYRLAPEYPGTILVDDGRAALAWFVERVDKFGVEEARIAIAGDSGGGGVAAGVAIAARDSGIHVANQMLIYPMLDDRTVEPDPEIEPFAIWTYDNNFTGWNALLGSNRGTKNVSPLAVPSRLTDFAGLAPAFIDVGELDIFRDESILYALNLGGAGVSTELHVRPGCPHGFDRTAAEVSVRAWEDRYRAIQAV
jgi:acetyl esterase/lipase